MFWPFYSFIRAASVTPVACTLATFWTDKTGSQLRFARKQDLNLKQTRREDMREEVGYLIISFPYTYIKLYKNSENRQSLE